MANPPKAKGTGAETELKRRLAEYGIEVQRTAASSTYDLDRGAGDEGLEILATRPDRGEWLVTLRLHDLATLINIADANPLTSAGVLPLHIEVNRYARFALHTIFKNKFGAA